MVDELTSKNTSFVDLLEGSGLDRGGDTDDPVIFQHSPYYDKAGFHEILKNCGNSFKILSLNCQSLNAKLEQLKIYVETYNNDACIDILCLQETWLTAASDLSQFQIPGYDLIVSSKSCTSHAGVAMYIHERFKYRIIDSDVSEIWDGLFLEVTVENNLHESKSIIIGNIYRPPRQSVVNLVTFTNEIANLINQFQNNKHVVFTGDFNIDLLKYKQNNHINDFLETLISNGYVPKITMPTRLNELSATLIDNIFVKVSENFSTTTGAVLINQISDHLPCFLSLDYLMYRKPNNKLVKIITSESTAYAGFKSELQSQTVKNKLSDIIGSGPNESYGKLNFILEELTNKYFPVKYVRFKKYKHKKSKWVTNGILKSIFYRDKLYTKLKTTPFNDIMYDARKRNLKTYNIILKKCIRQAKLDYYQKSFSNFKNDVKKTWQLINQIISKTSKKHDFPKSFLVNGSYITDKTEIANEFNKYFIHIGPQLAAGISVDTEKTFKDYLNCCHDDDFAFKNVDNSTVLKVIDSLKSKVSSGSDKISNKLLKHVKHELTDPLTRIINQTIDTGIFPDLLKIAKVTPIFKKGNMDEFSNYRPVSVLPSVSKVFERIMHNQIYEYFTKQKLLFPSQYGFRKNHSTELAALELIDKIIQDMDKKKTSNQYLSRSLKGL